MSDYISNTLKAYDDVNKYESGTALLIPKIELDKFLELLSSDSKILDVGCAFGRDTKYIYDKGYGVQGSDLSESLIARAKELYPEITFTVADVRNQPFDNDTFDGVWCNATLLHLNDEDMKLALKDILRLLKPGGVLCCSLKKGDGEETFVESFSANVERYFNFKTIETFEEIATSVGFEVISSHYLNERERYGQDKRDLDWLYSYLRKPQ